MQSLLLFKQKNLLSQPNLLQIDEEGNKSSEDSDIKNSRKHDELRRTQKPVPLQGL